MNDSNLPARQVWVIPMDPMDLAPLPALLRGEEIAIFCRRQKTFGAFAGPLPTLLWSVYDDFEGCRAAMIEGRTQALRDTRDHARHLAATIEHLRTIPPTPFPDFSNVEREVREQEGQQEKGQGQQEAQAEEVRPAAKPELKRPLRKNNAQA